MIDYDQYDRVPDESETAERLAAMSRHISVTAIEATLRMLSDADTAVIARRIAAVAQHISQAAEEMAVSVQAERVAESFDAARRAPFSEAS